MAGWVDVVYGFDMHPYLFRLGPIQVHSYGFMMAAGFAAGLLHWIWLGRKRGFSASLCTDLMIWVMVSGIVGSRVAYVLENLAAFAAHPAQMMRIDQGGLVFYGGFAGAALAVMLFAKRHKLALVPLVDFTLTAVPLSHGFGRIGCFLNSCCFGSVCGGGSCGVAFPRFSQPWHQHVHAGLIEAHTTSSLAVHPVQLYEAAWNLLLYGVLLRVYHRQRRAGLVSALYLLLYSLGRFVLEYFRGDHAVRAGLGGFSVGQIVSLFLLSAGMGLLAAAWRGTRKRSVSAAMEV